LPAATGLGFIIRHFSSVRKPPNHNPQDPASDSGEHEDARAASNGKAAKG
jgi:hypothetical protein